MRARVLRVPDLTVVGSSPDETFLNGRRRDGKHHFAIKLPEIIPDNAPRRHDVLRILRGKVGTDYAPALAGVGSSKNYLAAVVNRVVIERIDRQRSSPVAAIFRIVRRRVERVQPRTHRSRELRLRVPARHLVAVASGPNNIRVGRIGVREAGLAPAHSPVPARLGRTPEPS